MSHVPIGSFLLLVGLDVGLVLTMSAIFGVVMAKAAGATVWLGLVVGILLPVLGPLVWSVVVIGRDPSLGRVSRAQQRGPGLLVAVGLLGLAAVLFLVSTTQAWGRVSGRAAGYALGASASPADTGTGMVATIGSAVLLLVAGLVLLVSSSRRRVAVVTGFVAGAWLLVTVDGWIVLSALDGAARTVESVAGDQVVARATPSSALWLCLGAAALTLLATLAVLVPARDGAAARLVGPSPSGPSPRPEQPGSVDWGAPVGGGPAGSTGSSDWGSAPSDWGGRSW